MKQFFVDIWNFLQRNFRLAFRMLRKPAAAWTVVASLEERQVAQFFYLFVGITAFLKFVCFWIFDGSFSLALLAAFFRFFSLMITWWISLRFLPWLAQRFFRVDTGKQTIAMLVAFGLLPVFLIYWLLAFTSAEFLYLLAVCNYFIVLSGVDHLLEVDKKLRGRLIVSLTLWLVVLPPLVDHLLRLLVPNAAI